MSSSDKPFPPVPPIPPAPHADTLGTVEELLAHFAQLEAQFQSIRDGLTHSHRLATLGTIASIIAHEYNNILTPVITYAQMALAAPDDRELCHKALEKALQGAQRAAHISSSLLGFAREADAGHVARLPQVIDDSIACLARDPRKEGIELIIDVPDVLVSISEQALQQVLVNLLLNAKTAMARKGGQLRITARIEDAQVHIDVADTGPGIPPQIADRLFEPFVTHGCGEQGGSAQRKGTGLGLSICRDLIRTAGGSIHATSAPGQGATFHISLPKADDIFESE